MHPPWQLDFLDAPMFVGDELAVGEWRCAGRPVPSHEVTRYVELGLQRAGSHVRTVGREQRLVDPTIATFNAAGDELAIASPRPHRSTSVLVRGRLAEELAPRVPARFAPTSPDTVRLHARLLHAAEPLAIEEIALALLDRIAADAGAWRPEPELASTPARRILADEARHVIATRFAERLTIGAIAAACGTSAFHLSRVFRAVTGETLHRHLTRIRLIAAVLDLPHSAGRLTDLAFSVGFSSHSHFTQAFRVEFGCAPSAYDARAAGGRGAGRMRGPSPGRARALR